MPTDTKLASEILAEVLTRLHRAGMFSTDGMSDESIAFVKEDALCGIQLVLDGHSK